MIKDKKIKILVILATTLLILACLYFPQRTLFPDMVDIGDKSSNNQEVATDNGENLKNASLENLDGTADQADKNSSQGSGNKEAVNDKWVKDKVKDNFSKIDKGDLIEGLSIAAKLDKGYIFSLTSGGLSGEEKKELKSYLKEQLTSSEIDTAVKLYHKYKGMAGVIF